MSETTHTDEEQAAKRLAAKLAPSDAKFVFVCVDCNTAWTKQRDCKTTRVLRNGKTACGDCGNELTMVIDKKQ